MTHQFIPLNQLHISKFNARPGKKVNRVEALAADIKANGQLHDIVVRPEGEGFGILAGQRRFAALNYLAKSTPDIEAGCNVLDVADKQARAVSLSENHQVDGMDITDLWLAFAGLKKDGWDVKMIADVYCKSQKEVRQVLALGGLPKMILTAYEKDDINADALQLLAIAPKAKHREWAKLYKTGEYPAYGHSLREWLYNSSRVYKTSVALFDVEASGLAVYSDLFDDEDEAVFADSQAFIDMQTEAVKLKLAEFKASGWVDAVIVADFRSWDYTKTSKKNGGKIFADGQADGSVKFHKGYLLTKDVEKKEKAKQAGGDESGLGVSEKPEISAATQEYIKHYFIQVARTHAISDNALSVRLLLVMLISSSEASLNTQRCSEFDKIAEQQGQGEIYETEAYQSWIKRRDKAYARIGFENGFLGRWNSFNELLPVVLKLTDEQVSDLISAVTSDLITQHGHAGLAVTGQHISLMAEHWAAETGKVFFSKVRNKKVLLAMLSELIDQKTADNHANDKIKDLQRLVAERARATPEWMPAYFRGEAYGVGSAPGYIDQMNPPQ